MDRFRTVWRKYRESRRFFEVLRIIMGFYLILQLCVIGMGMVMVRLTTDFL